MRQLPAELLAPFRPRAARWVAGVLIALTVGGALAVIVLMPGVSEGDFGLVDQLFTAALAGGICWFIYRQGSVSARPTASGLAVRNLIHSRTLDWAEILGVNFGSGDPWVRLDLIDGETLAVMAIQSADGEHGKREASRLATLVKLYETNDEQR
ncbi:PH domain-containing protein [Bogoriella caseilytica]|uniref:PH (Pleckstrin Homology) domain-containing protein n=1 Tax=Bogoriella caseilytica TaxID=56055 RepID=A0A3N2BGP7_9MICO|nr:PH domain-containing protein [Bogoriella caseilytica]ROR74398.1 PH (Pleckstrin Homology) domain-containing protein [Bogoriella caseilytica]